MSISDIIEILRCAKDELGDLVITQFWDAYEGCVNLDADMEVYVQECPYSMVSGLGIIGIRKKKDNKESD